MMARSTVTDFLDSWGVTLDELGDLMPAIRPSDTLLLTGSVNGGLAHRNAVLDMLLIGSGTRPSTTGAALAPSASYTLGVGRSVQVRFFAAEALEQIATTTSRFDEALYEPAALARIARLSEDTRLLLHEVRVGYGLLNPSIAQAWREALRADRLHCYLTVLHLMRHRARLRSAVSYAMDGDAETTQWMIKESVEELLALVLAAAQETNPRKRWHLRLLRDKEAVVGQEGVSRLVAALCTWRHNIPEYLDEVVALSDDMIALSARLCPEIAGVLDME